MDDKNDEFQESVNSHFRKHFLHRHRRRHCLSSLLSEPVFLMMKMGLAFSINPFRVATHDTQGCGDGIFP